MFVLYLMQKSALKTYNWLFYDCFYLATTADEHISVWSFCFKSLDRIWKLECYKSLKTVMLQL